MVTDFATSTQRVCIYIDIRRQIKGLYCLTELGWIDLCHYKWLDIEIGINPPAGHASRIRVDFVQVHNQMY